MKLNQNDQREEMAAIGTMILLTAVAIILVIKTIFDLWN
jgi:hypothetical protein